MLIIWLGRLFYKYFLKLILCHKLQNFFFDPSIKPQEHAIDQSWDFIPDIIGVKKSSVELICKGDFSGLINQLKEKNQKTRDRMILDLIENCGTARHELLNTLDRLKETYEEGRKSIRTARLESAINESVENIGHFVDEIKLLYQGNEK